MTQATPFFNFVLHLVTAGALVTILALAVYVTLTRK